jgi:hypothetical protein
MGLPVDTYIEVIAAIAKITENAQKRGATISKTQTLKRVDEYMGGLR